MYILCVCVADTYICVYIDMYVCILYIGTYILKVSCFHIIFNFNKNLFLTALRLRHRVRSCPSCSEWGLPSRCGARLLVAMASLAAERRLQGARLQKWHTGCFPAACVWNPRGPGIEPASPALQGDSSPLDTIYLCVCVYYMFIYCMYLCTPKNGIVGKREK